MLAIMLCQHPGDEDLCKLNLPAHLVYANSGGKRQGILALHMIKPQWCRLEKNHEFLVHMQLFQILKYKFFFLDDVKKIAFLLS